ncbi:acyltransferase family protein [Pseudomonas aeruginosa]|uniref:acyltransferase family protein n=1 Tax=Pseudomonas aeruginosa TaxID=287 RepID=UPI00104EDE9A|nr:acyltransferase [Pseudomonas aeruginosa]MDV7845910.1 acyltransferase [Pseudomonas aeruginosa]HCE6897198.1 acyltransferase [Pseudomonas aeruginosa]HCE6902939.1 acyltransferase [Pseudomonas aeruginosa]HCE7019859.1 acyltransferase [Pseudomonas aeruginosa]HCE7064442.1 acyltransferase [Pseudomonas aeruginosa]
MTFNPNSRYHSRLIRAFAEGKEMLYGIQYLRGIAALIVVLFHFRFVLDNVYPDNRLGTHMFGGGAVGVDIFFMISGFIIVFATKNIKDANPIDFMVRRGLRIYPLLLITIITGGLTIYSKYDIHQLVRAAIPLNKDFSLVGPTFGYNIHGPAWTLTYELYFYAIFCISMMISHRWRTAVCCLILGSQIIIPQLAFDGHLTLSAAHSIAYPADYPLPSLAKLATSTMFYEFILGMVMCEVFLSKISIGETASLWALIIGSWIFFIFFTSQYNQGFGPQGFGTWGVLMFIGIIFYQKSNAISENKTLNFLGDISYSMYLVHYLVVAAVPTYFTSIWAATSGVSRMLLLLLVTFILSTVAHFLVEKPAINFGKHIIKRRRKAVAPPLKPSVV